MKVFCTERLFDQKTYYEDTEYNLTKEETERLIKNGQGKRFTKEDGTLLAQPMKKETSETATAEIVSGDANEKLLVLEKIGEIKAEVKGLNEAETELKKTIDLKKKAVKAKNTPADAVEGLNKEIDDFEAELERTKEHIKKSETEIKILYDQLDKLIGA